MSTPPKITPTTPQSEPFVLGPTPAVVQARVASDQARLRAVLLSLRKQTASPATFDKFLGCLSPTTAVDTRLPVTPQRVITQENRTAVLYNLIANAIVKWGDMARTLQIAQTPELDLLETVSKIGLSSYGAFPKERNSAIMVLRTAKDERALRADRTRMEETARELRARLADSQKSGGENEVR